MAMKTQITAKDSMPLQGPKLSTSAISSYAKKTPGTAGRASAAMTMLPYKSGSPNGIIRRSEIPKLRQDSINAVYPEPIDNVNPYFRYDPYVSALKVIDDGYNNGLNFLGTGIDNAFDTVVGGAAGEVAGFFGGDQARKTAKDTLSNFLTGEQVGQLLDVGTDIGLSMIPGVGVPLVATKSVLRNADDIGSAIEGRDWYTGEDLDAGQRVARGLSSAADIALAAIPGARVAKGLKKAKNAQIDDVLGLISEGSPKVTGSQRILNLVDMSDDQKNAINRVLRNPKKIRNLDQDSINYLMRETGLGSKRQLRKGLSKANKEYGYQPYNKVLEDISNNQGPLVYRTAKDQIKIPAALQKGNRQIKIANPYLPHTSGRLAQSGRDAMAMGHMPTKREAYAMMREIQKNPELLETAYGINPVDLASIAMKESKTGILPGALKRARTKYKDKLGNNPSNDEIKDFIANELTEKERDKLINQGALKRLSKASRDKPNMYRKLDTDTGLKGRAASTALDLAALGTGSVAEGLRAAAENGADPFAYMQDPANLTAYIPNLALLAATRGRMRKLGTNRTMQSKLNDLARLQAMRSLANEGDEWYQLSAEDPDMTTDDAIAALRMYRKKE